MQGTGLPQLPSNPNKFSHRILGLAEPEKVPQFFPQTSFMAEINNEQIAAINAAKLLENLGANTIQKDNITNYCTELLRQIAGYSIKDEKMFFDIYKFAFHLTGYQTTDLHELKRQLTERQKNSKFDTSLVPHDFNFALNNINTDNWNKEQAQALARMAGQLFNVLCNALTTETLEVIDQHINSRLTIPYFPANQLSHQASNINQNNPLLVPASTLNTQPSLPTRQRQFQPITTQSQYIQTQPDLIRNLPKQQNSKEDEEITRYFNQSTNHNAQIPPSFHTNNNMRFTNLSDVPVNYPVPSKPIPIFYNSIHVDRHFNPQSDFSLDQTQSSTHNPYIIAHKRNFDEVSNNTSSSTIPKPRRNRAKKNTLNLNVINQLPETFTANNNTIAFAPDKNISAIRSSYQQSHLPQNNFPLTTHNNPNQNSSLPTKHQTASTSERPIPQDRNSKEYKKFIYEEYHRIYRVKNTPVDAIDYGLQHVHECSEVIQVPSELIDFYLLRRPFNDFGHNYTFVNLRDLFKQIEKEGLIKRYNGQTFFYLNSLLKKKGLISFLWSAKHSQPLLRGVSHTNPVERHFVEACKIIKKHYPSQYKSYLITNNQQEINAPHADYVEVLTPTSPINNTSEIMATLLKYNNIDPATIEPDRSISQILSETEQVLPTKLLGGDKKLRFFTGWGEDTTPKKMPPGVFTPPPYEVASPIPNNSEMSNNEHDTRTISASQSKDSSQDNNTNEKQSPQPSTSKIAQPSQPKTYGSKQRSSKASTGTTRQQLTSAAKKDRARSFINDDSSSDRELE